MYSAMNAFYIWKIINESINIHQNGGEIMANENLKLVINKYKYFFQQTINNSYKTFIIDLGIFFDAERYEEAFSLGKLIKIIEDQGIDISQLNIEIDNLKNPHGKLISLIIKLRNQDVAHQGINPEQHSLVFVEVEGLFKAVQDILNKLTKYYDNSSTFWDQVEEDIKGDIDWIFENLKRGEKERLREIDEKYKV